MRKLITIALLLAAALVPTSVLVPTAVQASHKSPLYKAADHYRKAVVDFERQVIHVRYIDRYDVRLVDDLEDSTSELRSASYDPFRNNRFSYAWDNSSTLHHRVEARIFGGNYPNDPGLVHKWKAVVCAYTDLAAQVNHLSNNVQVHHSGGAVYLPTVPTPQRESLRIEAPTYNRSISIKQSGHRTIDRPTIGAPQSVHFDNVHFGNRLGYDAPHRYAIPSHQPVAHQPVAHHSAGNDDVGAVVVRALLTRLLN